MNEVSRLFNVNLKRLALLTLPTWLRRPLCSGLIYAGIYPLARMLQDLRRYRVRTRYRLAHSGQVCRLRKVLNDSFDVELRRIRIEDNDETRGGTIIYKRGVGRWVMLRCGGDIVRINREGYGGTSGYDFWVIVPGNFSEDKARLLRLRAMIDMYKLAGKRYAINFE